MKKRWYILIACLAVVAIGGGAIYAAQHPNEKYLTEKQKIRDKEKFKKMVAKPNEVPKWMADDHELISFNDYKSLVDKVFENNPADQQRTLTTKDTVLIPGLRGAWSIDYQTKQAAFGNDWVPQGLAQSDKFYFISEYDGDHKLNSLILLVDKKTHKYVKSLILPRKSHAGGVTYDAKHKRLWWSTDHTSFAGLSYANLDQIEKYDARKVQGPINAKSVSIPWAVRTSAICYYNDQMAIAKYGNSLKNRSVAIIQFDKNTGLPPKNVSELPEYTGDNPSEYIRSLFKGGQLKLVAPGYNHMQGIAITTYGFTVFSISNGTENSKLLVKIPNGKKGDAFNYTTKNYYGTTSQIVPPAVEQISINTPTNTQLAILFESGAKKYREEGSYNHRQPIMDRILIDQMSVHKNPGKAK